jgi:hypothetical protein
MATVNVAVDNYHCLYLDRQNPTLGQVPLPPAMRTDPRQPVYQYNNLDLSDVECLYIAAWSDWGTRQGLLVSILGWFKPEILGGDRQWEVYPTNRSHRGPAPTVDVVEKSIAKANWLIPAVGPDNSGVDKTFRVVSSINRCASWMWYASGRTNIREKPSNPLPPFTPGVDHGEFLLFRLSVPPSSHRNARFL